MRFLPFFAPPEMRRAARERACNAVSLHGPKAEGYLRHRLKQRRRSLRGRLIMSLAIYYVRHGKISIERIAVARKSERAQPPVVAVNVQPLRREFSFSADNIARRPISEGRWRARIPPAPELELTTQMEVRV